MDGPTCERCGSDDLRRAHARSLWRRLYRSATGLQRYACNACRHRGWTDGELRSLTPRGTGRRQRVPGRPIEHRDLVAKREAAREKSMFIVFAVLLGAAIAGLIGWAFG